MTTAAAILLGVWLTILFALNAFVIFTAEDGEEITVRLTVAVLTVMTVALL